MPRGPTKTLISWPLLPSTTSTMEAKLLQKPDLLETAIGQVICLVALTIAGRRYVALRAAASSLGSEDIKVVAKQEARVAEGLGPQRPLSPWRKRLRSPQAAMLFGAACGMTGYGIFHLVFQWFLPRFTSQGVLDGTYAVCIWAFFSIAFYEAFKTLVPVPEGLCYARFETSNPSTPMVLLHVLVGQPADRKLIHRTSPRIVTACIVSGIVTFGCYLGGTVPGYIAGAAFILAFPHLRAVISVRRTTQVLIGSMVFTIAFLSVIAIFAYLMGPGSDPTPPTENAPEQKNPSAWILRASLLWLESLAWSAPGYLALLTMRFEYFASAGYPVTERDAATGTVVVPTSVPSVSTPLFNMSRLTIFAVMMVLHAISTLPGMWLMIYLIPVLAVFITVPAMTLVLVLDVWRRGLLSEWWSYSEVWIPPADSLLPPDADKRKFDTL